MLYFISALVKVRSLTVSVSDDFSVKQQHSFLCLIVGMKDQVGVQIVQIAQTEGAFRLLFYDN